MIRTTAIHLGHFISLLPFLYFTARIRKVIHFSIDFDVSYTAKLILIIKLYNYRLAGSVCTQCPASAVESCGAWSWDAYLDKVKVDSMQPRLNLTSVRRRMPCMHACRLASCLNSLNILQMYEFITNSYI